MAEQSPTLVIILGISVDIYNIPFNVTPIINEAMRGSRRFEANRQ